jgi:hypothetical protein
VTWVGPRHYGVMASAVPGTPSYRLFITPDHVVYDPTAVHSVQTFTPPHPVSSVRADPQEILGKQFFSDAVALNNSRVFDYSATTARADRWASAMEDGLVSALKHMKKPEELKRLRGAIRARSTVTAQIIGMQGFAGCGKTHSLFSLLNSPKYQKLAFGGICVVCPRKFLQQKWQVDLHITCTEKCSVDHSVSPRRQSFLKSIVKTQDYALWQACSSARTVIIDEYALLEPGYIDCLIMRGANRLILLGDASQVTAHVSNPDANLLQLGSERDRFARFLGPYMFWTWRLPFVMADFFGIMTFSQHVGRITFHTDFDYSLPTLFCSQAQVNQHFSPGKDGSPSVSPFHAEVMTFAGSQGQDWDAVQLVITDNCFDMLSDEMVYVGFTRARRHYRIVNMYSGSQRCNMLKNGHWFFGPFYRRFHDSVDNSARCLWWQRLGTPLIHNPVVFEPAGSVRLTQDDLVEGSVAHALFTTDGLQQTYTYFDAPPADPSLDVPTLPRDQVPFEHSTLLDGTLDHKNQFKLATSNLPLVTDREVWSDKRQIWSDQFHELPRPVSGPKSLFTNDYIVNRNGQLVNLRDQQGVNIFPRQYLADNVTRESGLVRLKFAAYWKNAEMMARSEAVAMHLWSRFQQTFLKAGIPSFDPTLFDECRRSWESKKLEKGVKALYANRDRADNKAWPWNYLDIFAKSQLVGKMTSAFGVFKKAQPLATFSDEPLFKLSHVSRYLVKQLQATLPDWVFFNCERDAEDLDNWAKSHWKNRSCRSNDFTAFDASQTAQVLLFEIYMLRAFGIPAAEIEYYIELKLDAYCRYGHLAVMRFTGEFSTFLFNSTMNLAYLACHYDLTNEPTVVAGDDSSICGDPPVSALWCWLQTKIDLKGKPLLETRAEFCGWLITHLGIMRNPTSLLYKMFAKDGQGKLRQSFLSFWIEHSWAKQRGDDLFWLLTPEQLDHFWTCESIFRSRFSWLPYLLAFSKSRYQDIKAIFKGLSTDERNAYGHKHSSTERQRWFYKHFGVSYFQFYA